MALLKPLALTAIGLTVVTAAYALVNYTQLSSTGGVVVIAEEIRKPVADLNPVTQENVIGVENNRSVPVNATIPHLHVPSFSIAGNTVKTGLQSTVVPIVPHHDVSTVGGTTAPDIAANNGFIGSNYVGADQNVHFVSFLQPAVAASGVGVATTGTQAASSGIGLINQFPVNQYKSSEQTIGKTPAVAASGTPVADIGSYGYGLYAAVSATQPQWMPGGGSIQNDQPANSSYLLYNSPVGTSANAVVFASTISDPVLILPDQQDVDVTTSPSTLGNDPPSQTPFDSQIVTTALIDSSAVPTMPEALGFSATPTAFSPLTLDIELVDTASIIRSTISGADTNIQVDSGDSADSLVSVVSNAVAVPEPATLALFASALIGMGLVLRLRGYPGVEQDQTS